MRFLWLLCVLFCFGSCSQEKKRKLILYTDTPEALTLELTGLFEKQHGIEVEEVMEGTSWLLTRLRAERGHPIADVFMGASGTVPGAIGAREELLAVYQPQVLGQLPVIESGLQLRDPQWRWVGFGFASLGLAYSLTTLQPQELPQSWDNLSDPQWHQDLTIWDPSVSGTATFFLASSLWRAISEGRGENGGWEFLKGFHRNLKKYSEEGPPAFIVAKGIVKLGVHLDNQFIYYKGKLKQGGDSLMFHLPKPYLVVTDPVGLVQGAPHAQEGRLFIDFLFSQEAQQILARNFWIRDHEGHLIAPAQHPLGALIAQSHFQDSVQKFDFDWLAQNFDRIRVHWQNHIEE